MTGRAGQRMGHLCPSPSLLYWEAKYAPKTCPLNPRAHLAQQNLLMDCNIDVCLQAPSPSSFQGFPHACFQSQDKQCMHLKPTRPLGLPLNREKSIFKLIAHAYMPLTSAARASHPELEPGESLPDRVLEEAEAWLRESGQGRPQQSSIRTGGMKVDVFGHHSRGNIALGRAEP